MAPELPAIILESREALEEIRGQKSIEGLRPKISRFGSRKNLVSRGHVTLTSR